MEFTPSELDAARKALAGPGHNGNPAGRAAVQAALRCGENRARQIVKHLKSGDAPQETPRQAKAVESEEVSGDKRTLTRVTSERIKTLADLVRVCEVDEQEWEVERYTVNKWDVGMRPAAVTEYVQTKDGRTIPSFVREKGEPLVVELYQVKAWLKRKTVVISIRDQVEELQRKADGYAPHYPAIIFRDLKKTGNMAEISIYDHHFGALIWGKETGWADYDTAIAGRVFRDALENLLSRVQGYGIDRIILSLGNDLQNSDNRAGTTEAGTPQANDSRYQRVCGVVQDAAVWAIEACREAAPDVLVPMVPGNHDPLTTFHLGGYLSAWFRQCPGVRIDNSHLERKAYQHGTVMLMLTHGKGIQTAEYPLLMATEFPHMWAATTWRETHTGHIHTRRKMIPEMDEVRGVAVRSMPSLRPPCAWSSGLGYVGNMRSAEACVFNDREGLIGTAVYSMPEERVA